MKTGQMTSRQSCGRPDEIMTNLVGLRVKCGQGAGRKPVAAIFYFCGQWMADVAVSFASSFRTFNMSYLMLTDVFVIYSWRDRYFVFAFASHRDSEMLRQKFDGWTATVFLFNFRAIQVSQSPASASLSTIIQKWFHQIGRFPERLSN